MCGDCYWLDYQGTSQGPYNFEVLSLLLCFVFIWNCNAVAPCQFFVVFLFSPWKITYKFLMTANFFLIPDKFVYKFSCCDGGFVTWGAFRFRNFLLVWLFVVHYSSFIKLHNPQGRSHCVGLMIPGCAASNESNWMARRKHPSSGDSKTRCRCWKSS